MSTFNLTKIYIKNFRSIKEETFEIKPGLFSVEGLNLDQMSSNNGAGKTSLISSLWWCLTGSSLNNETLADEVINLQSGKDCRIECYFSTDNGDLKIVRTRKDTEFGNNLFLQVNDQDLSCHKISDTQDRINQIFKVNWDLLKSTIIMTSDMKSCFSSLTPQNRIALLESVRDYSIWNKVREESNKDIKEFDSQIKQNTSEINILQGNIDTYNKLIKDNEYSLENLKNSFNEGQIKNDIIDLDNQIKEKQTEIDNIPLDSNNETIELNGEITNLKLQQQEVVNNGNSLNKQIQDIEFELRQASFETETIKKWFTNDTCPTCGRKLDRTQEEINEKTNKQNELSVKIGQLMFSKTKLEEKVKSERQKYSDFEIEIQKVQQQISEINQKYKERSDKVLKLTNDINSIKLSKNSLENKLKDQDYKVKNLEDSINSHKTEIDKKNQEKQILEDKNKDLEDEKEISKFFYDVLGPKGSFRPSLLRKDINYLNQCISRYTKRFFDNTEISLSTPDMENNKIDIIIKQGKLIKPVSSLSGGETKRLNLCIQLGIYDLIKSTCLVDFNFVVFDEIESQMDEQGIRSLIDIIDERRDYISTILWITNNPMVKESVEDKVLCKKAMGYTTIEYK